MNQVKDQTAAAQHVRFLHTNYKNKDMRNFIEALQLDQNSPHIVVLKGSMRYSVYSGTSDNELDEYLDAFAKGDLQMQLVRPKPQRNTTYDDDEDF